MDLFGFALILVALLCFSLLTFAEDVGTIELGSVGSHQQTASEFHWESKRLAATNSSKSQTGRKRERNEQRKKEREREREGERIRKKERKKEAKATCIRQL